MEIGMKIDWSLRKEFLLEMVDDFYPDKIRFLNSSHYSLLKAAYGESDHGLGILRGNGEAGLVPTLMEYLYALSEKTKLAKDFIPTAEKEQEYISKVEKNHLGALQELTNDGVFTSDEWPEAWSEAVYRSACINNFMNFMYGYTFLRYLAEERHGIKSVLTETFEPLKAYILSIKNYGRFKRSCDRHGLSKWGVIVVISADSYQNKGEQILRSVIESNDEEILFQRIPFNGLDKIIFGLEHSSRRKIKNLVSIIKKPHRANIPALLGNQLNLRALENYRKELFKKISIEKEKENVYQGVINSGIISRWYGSSEATARSSASRNDIFSISD